MVFKRVVSDRKFWRLVVFQGLAFALIYQVISIFFEYGGFNFSAYFEDKLGDGRWIKYLTGTLLAAFVYGFIISYGQFQTRLKKEDRENY